MNVLRCLVAVIGTNAALESLSFDLNDHPFTKKKVQASDRVYATDTTYLQYGKK